MKPRQALCKESLPFGCWISFLSWRRHTQSCLMTLPLEWACQRVWGEESVPVSHETLPCRGILGDFPSAPMSRMSLPYSTVRVAVPSLPEQRLLLRTFPAGLPAWAGALQGRTTLTAERRRWEHPCSALQPGLLLPTLQRWPVWWGSGDTGAGLAPCRYRGTLLSALILRWSFWLPPRSQDAPELKKNQKGKLKEMITLFRGPQRTWENMQGSGYPGQNYQTSFLRRFHINHVRIDEATKIQNSGPEILPIQVK